MQVRNTLRKLALGALLVGASGTLSACIINDPGSSSGGYHDRDDGYGSYPPAHPRHGYRYGYPGGVSLIFDSGLGLYSVYGYPDYYYNDGYFYRWNSGYWNRSRHWNNHWQRCDERHWPRPIHNIHNNYYGHGRRPQHDWDRDGRHDGHGDGDHHGNGPGDHDGRDEHRDLIDEVRERARERDPVDHQRQMDEAQRGEKHRSLQEAAAHEQAARQEAERGVREQQGRERGERAAAEQAEHAQRREERSEEQRSRDAESREHDNRGGEGGDSLEDVHGDRR